MDPHLYDKFFEIEDRFWWSVGTRRIFFDQIARLPCAGGTVVDVGCGTGATLREFPPGWSLVAGCDYSAQALTYCRRRGLDHLVRCDATRLPFASESLDLLLALDIVEHLDDDVGCLREMARACKPGGHVLLHVPAFPILWSDKDVLNHHRRRYRRQALRALVAQCGLSVERLFFANFTVFPVALCLSLVHRALGRTAGSDPAAAAERIDRLYRIPGGLNRLMIRLMDLERRIANRVPVPFGMSMVCLARKP